MTLAVNDLFGTPHVYTVSELLGHVALTSTTGDTHGVGPCFLDDV